MSLRDRKKKTATNFSSHKNITDFESGICQARQKAKLGAIFLRILTFLEQCLFGRWHIFQTAIDFNSEHASF